MFVGRQRVAFNPLARSASSCVSSSPSRSFSSASATPVAPASRASCRSSSNVVSGVDSWQIEYFGWCDTTVSFALPVRAENPYPGLDLTARSTSE